MANSISIRDFEFQGSPIRCVGTDRDLWFVAKDVCEALGIAWRGVATLDCIPAAWKDVRKLRIGQKNQYGQHGYAMIDVNVISEAAVYKLAFRSNNPAADEFTNWVASDVLPSIRRSGLYVSARRGKYIRAGKTEAWIEEREEGIDTRKGFTDMLKAHKVEGQGYGQCTDAIYRPTIGAGAKLARVHRGLKPKANLRDNLSTTELAKVKFAELLASERIEQDQIEGNDKCTLACRISGQAVAAAAQIAISAPLVPPSVDS